MINSKPVSNNAQRFRPWMLQSRLDDWRNLLAQSYRDIDLMASEAGIDWGVLSQQLPPCGVLLKGNSVPVVTQRDRGRCAFIWHLNPDRYGNSWPCLVFMSFRHGGVHQIFHGYRWAWLAFSSGSQLAPQANLYIRQASPENERARAEQDAREAKRCLERFHSHNRQWHAATRATADHPLLSKRLCGYASADLLARLSLRSFEHSRGAGLMVRLQSYDHGHCGFQQLHAKPLDSNGRTQHLVIRQRGMKQGSFVCIHASPGHEGWPVAICEGVFTALSVALGWPGPIAIALDAGNLRPVRQMIKRSCVFFADDDTWSASNTGLLRAEQAMKPGDRLVFPRFRPAHAAERPTDFNDLLRLAGHGELLRQVRTAWPAP